MCKTKLSLTIKTWEIRNGKVTSKELTGICFKRSVCVCIIKNTSAHNLFLHQSVKTSLPVFLHSPKMSLSIDQSSRSRISGWSFYECVTYMTSHSHQESKAVECIPDKYLICIINNMIIYKEPLCIRPCEKMYSIYSYLWRA